MRAALLLLPAVLTLTPAGVWAQGSPVGPEFRVNTYTTSNQAQAAIAADGAGNFVVVWDGPGPSVPRSTFGQRFSGSGLPLGAEFRVNTGEDNYTAPAVAADTAGDFVVVWQASVLAPLSIRGQRFDSSGTALGGVFSVGTLGYHFNPAVASDTAGNFLIVWDDLFPGDGSARGVFGQRFASSGAPLALFRVNTYTTNDQTIPSVAVDSSGNAVVVWQSVQDGSGFGVYGQRYASTGAPLGPEFRVNTYTTNIQTNASVAAGSAGDFVVVWQTVDGPGAGISGQRYASSGAPLGPEFRVNTFTTADQVRPSVAADASGNFVVTWQGGGLGAAFEVFGQRYVADGTPLGSEFRVNTYTTSYQTSPAVAADPVGNFVVVWQSGLQDGSGYGVFGQRYLPILPVELMHFRVE